MHSFIIVRLLVVFCFDYCCVCSIRSISFRFESFYIYNISYTMSVGNSI